MKIEDRMIRYNLLLAVSIFCLIDAAGSSVHAAEAAKGLSSLQGTTGVEGAGPSSVPASTPSSNMNKELHNPLANLKELIFQLDVLPDAGPYEKTAYNFSAQPVYPFSLPNDWKLVTYSIIPVLSQPQVTADGSRTAGLGDTRFYGYFVPPKEEGLIWGFGPAAQFPTHTDSDLGSDKWAAGPALIVGAQPGNWSVWGLFDNIWSFAGSDEDINEFSFQYQVVYLLPKDWFLISNWVINADWEASSEDRWTVPIGGGFGRQFKFAGSQFQLYGQVGYNVEAPDEASSWRGITALTSVF
jgi:hypothetical protein